MKDRSRSVYDLGLLIVIVSALVFATISVHSQNQTAPQTPGAPAQAPRATPSPSPTPTPINWSTDPLLKRFVWRSIGPASMGGRIDDIACVEQNPYIIYVGFATNGLWKSTNNGTTFQPIFDTYGTHSIGDVAIAPSDQNIVWVGTGEANNRQSSSFGDGIYKSTDAGKTFTKMGLEDSQTIARIVIDPKDPNIVYVAVLGHLFGPNKERGIYKTTDGGKTWNNVKFIDEDTGFTDLRWTLPTAKFFTRLRTSDAVPASASMAVDREVESGRRSTPARRGKNSKAVGCQKDYWDVSESTSRVRIQTSSTRRWKWARV